MITPSDNTKAVDGKSLIGYRWDAAARGVVRTTTYSEYHGQALPALAGTDLHAVTEPLNVHRTKLRVESVTAEPLTDKNLGVDWGTLQRFADEWTTTKTRQTAATLTAGGLLVGASQVVQDYPASWARDTISVSGWATRTRYENDDTLGAVITINESVVAPGDALPANTGLKLYSKQEVDTWHSILREEVVGDGTTAWTRTYYTSDAYSFPGVLTSFSSSNLFDQYNLRSLFVITANVRQGFTIDTLHKHIETLVTPANVATLLASTPSGDGDDSTLALLKQPIMKDLSYNGLLFSVSVGNVLCNTSSLTATTASNDQYYGGGVSDTFSYTATNISATDYATLVSDALWWPIRDTLIPWKAGYFIRRRTFIKFL